MTKEQKEEAFEISWHLDCWKSKNGLHLTDEDLEQFQCTIKRLNQISKANRLPVNKQVLQDLEESVIVPQH